MDCSNRQAIQKLQTAGVPLEKIAAQLDVTPNSVQRRLYHLRGAVPAYASETSVLRARISKLPKERRARRDALLAAMRSAIQDGVWCDRAICEAKALGLGTQAIADALGVSRITIYRILVLQGAPERELKERAKKRRKEKVRVFRPAMDALRSAIARGVPRDRAIAEAYASGLTLAAIGKEVGLTRERVRQIIVMHEKWYFTYLHSVRPSGSSNARIDALVREISLCRREIFIHTGTFSRLPSYDVHASPCFRRGKGHPLRETKREPL